MPKQLFKSNQQQEKDLKNLRSSVEGVEQEIQDLQTQLADFQQQLESASPGSEDWMSLRQQIREAERAIEEGKADLGALSPLIENAQQKAGTVEFSKVHSSLRKRHAEFRKTRLEFAKALASSRALFMDLKALSEETQRDQQRFQILRKKFKIFGSGYEPHERRDSDGQPIWERYPLAQSAPFSIVVDRSMQEYIIRLLRQADQGEIKDVELKGLLLGLNTQ